MLGRAAEDWTDAKRSQKDVDSRWISRESTILNIGYKKPHQRELSQQIGAGLHGD